MAENLELRVDEFAGRIQEETDCSVDAAKQQVNMAVQRLFHWAAFADKYGGSVQVGRTDLKGPVDCSMNLIIVFTIN